MELLSHREGSEEAGFEGGRRLRGRRASKEVAMTAQKGGEAGMVWKEGVPVMRLAEGLLIHQGRVYSDCLGWPEGQRLSQRWRPRRECRFGESSGVMMVVVPPGGAIPVVGGKHSPWVSSLGLILICQNRPVNSIWWISQDVME